MDEFGKLCEPWLSNNSRTKLVVRLVLAERLADVVVNDSRALGSRFARSGAKQLCKLQRPDIGELATLKQTVDQASTRFCGSVESRKLLLSASVGRSPKIIEIDAAKKLAVIRKL